MSQVKHLHYRYHQRTALQVVVEGLVTAMLIMLLVSGVVGVGYFSDITGDKTQPQVVGVSNLLQVPPACMVVSVIGLLTIASQSVLGALANVACLTYLITVTRSIEDFIDDLDDKCTAKTGTITCANGFQITSADENRVQQLGIDMPQSVGAITLILSFFLILVYLYRDYKIGSLPCLKPKGRESSRSMTGEVHPGTPQDGEHPTP